MPLWGWSGEEAIPLVLMADYGASPLCNRGRDGLGEADIDLDTLPLSADLKQSLRAWAGRFDPLSRTDYEWSSSAVMEQWISDGRALREPVQLKLGPGYDVTYVDERGDPQARLSSPPRFAGRVLCERWQARLQRA